MLVIFFFFAIAYQVGLVGLTEATTISFPGSDFGGPGPIGDLLFREYLLPFEITSVLLLVAMVGAIVLTKSKARTRPQSDEENE
jgi:NADH-quinone oxidoreductase subunit J